MNPAPAAQGASTGAVSGSAPVVHAGGDATLAEAKQWGRLLLGLPAPTGSASGGVGAADVVPVPSATLAEQVHQARSDWTPARTGFELLGLPGPLAPSFGHGAEGANETEPGYCTGDLRSPVAAGDSGDSDWGDSSDVGDSDGGGDGGDD